MKSDEPNDFEKQKDEAPLSLPAEFWYFICENKAWWMIPILTVLSVIGLLVALSPTGAAPFIYTLF